MAKRYVWPRCTVPGCDHQRTWRTEAQAQKAYLRHSSWTVGSQATCHCHGPDVATFPCDKSLEVIHSV